MQVQTSEITPCLEKVDYFFDTTLKAAYKFPQNLVHSYNIFY